MPRARNPRSTTANRPAPVPYDQPIFIISHPELGMSHYLTREAMTTQLDSWINDDYGYREYDPDNFTICKVQSGVVTDITIKVKGFSFSDE